MVFYDLRSIEKSKQRRKATLLFSVELLFKYIDKIQLTYDFLKSYYC